MQKLKSERGAITLLVIVTMVFILSFLISTYVIVANKLKGQVERSKQIQETYNNLNDKDNIYNSYFAGDIINISTVEQLLKIGSNENIKINGKVYTFSSSAIYVLMDDLTFSASAYSTLLSNEDWTPIGDTDYKFEGNGHTITVTKRDSTVKEYNYENEYKDIEDAWDGTDLTGTVWYFNDVLDVNSDFKYYINFTALHPISGQSNTYSYIEALDCGPVGRTLCYESIERYYQDDGWLDMFEVCRTITITGGTDATNTEFISWLKANATFVSVNEQPTIISFTVDSRTYSAEEGMTWSQWVNYPSYNTDSFVIDNNYVRVSAASIISGVTAGNTIGNGNKYTTTIMGRRSWSLDHKLSDNDFWGHLPKTSCIIIRNDI